jgi:hypothetical protein
MESMCDTRRKSLPGNAGYPVRQTGRLCVPSSWLEELPTRASYMAASASSSSAMGRRVMRVVDGLTVLVFLVLCVVCLWEVMS